MPATRTYADPCGVARALDAVGERWALLVVRELLFGPKRFTDLSQGLPGMSQNVLTQRLRELEQAGIVRRRRLGPPARAGVYELTERGAALQPVLEALACWGSRIPLASTGDLSVDAFVLALKITFDPRAAGELAAAVRLQLGDDHFHATVADRVFRITRGDAEPTQTTLQADVRTLRGLVFGGRSLDDALHEGALRLDGDRDLAARFLASFPRPTTV